MTVAAPPFSSHSWQPQRVRWTVPQFHEVREAGRLWPLKNVILIDGELIEMPHPDAVHSRAIGKADYRLKELFPAGQYWVRVQMPLPFGINTDPAPDVAVVAGTPESLVDDPTTAELVLEVSNTSGAYDLGDKAGLYAAAGIPDYWVTDLTGGRVVVHRQPVPDPAARYGHRYSSVTELTRGQSLAPLALPGRPVAADELLP